MPVAAEGALAEVGDVAAEAAERDIAVVAAVACIVAALAAFTSRALEACAPAAEIVQAAALTRHWVAVAATAEGSAQSEIARDKIDRGNRWDRDRPIVPTSG
jgi:hypothetical protein